MADPAIVKAVLQQVLQMLDGIEGDKLSALAKPDNGLSAAAPPADTSGLPTDDSALDGLAEPDADDEDAKKLLALKGM